jgi:RNA polymerase sigma factor (sigma-70 family)
MSDVLRDELTSPDASDGDSDAVGWVVALAQFRPGLYRYLLRCLRNSADAEELSQEVYLRLLRVDDPRRVKNPQAYMYRVATNAFYEFRARAKINVVSYDSPVVDRLADEVADESPTAERLHAESGDQHAAAEWLAELPAVRRQVVIMAVCKGVSHTEIAATLGLPIHIVRNHLYRGLATCRKLAAERSLKDRIS